LSNDANGQLLDQFDVDNWMNPDADGSEETFAVFTPKLANDPINDQVNEHTDAIGTQFRYYDGSGWVDQTFNGDPIEVPIEFLHTLEFKAQDEFAAKFKIDVAVRTVDV